MLALSTGGLAAEPDFGPTGRPETRNDATGATMVDLGPPRRDRGETTTKVLGAVRLHVDQDGPLRNAKPA